MWGEPVAGHTGRDDGPCQPVNETALVELARRKPGAVLFSLHHVIGFECARGLLADPQEWSDRHRRCDGSGV
jgi:hypothetical protein